MPLGHPLIAGVSYLTSSGFGVGLISSLPPSLQLAKMHVSIASINNTFFIIMNVLVRWDSGIEV